MKDIEQARILATMARKDCAALAAMEDEELFAVEIYGFHVQQATEKALKAWLCCLGVTYPRIHDLDELGALVEDAEQTLPEPLVELLDYTDFAVGFRYDAYTETDAEIDRKHTSALVEQLIKHVEMVLEDTEGTE